MTADTHIAASINGATRIALAVIVNAGLSAAEDGKNDPPTIHRLSTSWLRQSELSTLLLGSLPTTAIPHMWEFV